MAEKRQEQSSFKVTDRRLFTADGELRNDVTEEVESPKAPTQAPPKDVSSVQQMPTPIPAPEAADAQDREIPPPPTSAEQEAQAAAYQQSAKDLDAQVELSGHSAKD